MSNHEAGFPFHQLPHGLLNLLLRLGIHIGGGLVQNQHFGIQQHGPGNGEHLLLPLGKAGAVPGQHRVVSLRHLKNGLVDMGRLAGPLHLLQGGVLLPVGKILVNGSRKQPGILQHHGISPAQAAPGEPGNLLAVHSDGAGPGIVKPHQQIDQRGFPGACGAHNGRQAARLGVKAEIMDDGLPRQIPEADMLHPHIPPHIRKLQRARRVCRLRRLVDETENPLRRRGGRLKLA